MDGWNVEKGALQQTHSEIAPAMLRSPPIDALLYIIRYLHDQAVKSSQKLAARRSPRAAAGEVGMTKHWHSHVSESFRSPLTKHLGLASR